MDIFNAGSFCDFISLTFQQPSSRSHSVRRPLDGNALLLQVQKAALTISSTCWGTGMSMNSSTCDFSQRKNTKSWHGGVLHVLTKVWHKQKKKTCSWNLQVHNSQERSHTSRLHISEITAVISQQQRKQSVICLPCLQMPATYQQDLG